MQRPPRTFLESPTVEYCICFIVKLLGLAAFGTHLEVQLCRVRVCHGGDTILWQRHTRIGPLMVFCAGAAEDRISGFSMTHPSHTHTTRSAEK